VALAPKRIKISEKPKINDKRLKIVFIEIFELDKSLIETPEMYEM
jgi:hypothetical protein